MSKEKDLLKEILANTKAIMQHLKISPSVATSKKSDKPSPAAKASPKKASAKKGK